MKKFFIYFSLSIFTTMGIYVMITAASLPRTYNGRSTNIAGLREESKNYTIENSEGTAEVIVKESLYKTRALNTVNAVLLDYRGYDGLAQAFILLAAITGSAIILRNEKQGREDSNEEKHQG